MIYLVIIVMCYSLVELLKKTPLVSEALPVISATLGAVISAISFYWLPDTVPAASMGEALTIGLMCGLATTGSNQIYKQAIKYFKNKYGINTTISDNKNTEE